MSSSLVKCLTVTVEAVLLPIIAVVVFGQGLINYRLVPIANEDCLEIDSKRCSVLEHP
ncbi:hypothetical protein BDW72DRAFT_175933 [Aspergillus terricola var. indicus]